MRKRAVFGTCEWRFGYTPCKWLSKAQVSHTLGLSIAQVRCAGLWLHSHKHESIRNEAAPAGGAGCSASPRCAQPSLASINLWCARITTNRQPLPPLTLTLPSCSGMAAAPAAGGGGGPLAPRPPWPLCCLPRKGSQTRRVPQQ